MKVMKRNSKNRHQWGKSLAKDFDRLMGGKGNEGMRPKDKRKS